MRKFTLALGLILVLISSAAFGQLQSEDVVWDDLKAAFNADQDKPRIVSVYGVSCVYCKFHRDDIRDQILSQCENPDLRWYIIWMEDPVNPSSRNDALNQSALTSDPRVTQWWYKEHQSSLPKNDSVAYKLGAASWINCSYAWNISMLFDSDAVWEGSAPPVADYCMSKVGGCCNEYSVTNFKKQVDALGQCNQEKGRLESNESEPSEFLIYPSPVYDVLSISAQREIDSSVSVKLYDLHGKIIYQEELNKFDPNQPFHIGLYIITGGVYMLELDYEGKKEYRKISLQK